MHLLIDTVKETGKKSTLPIKSPGRLWKLIDLQAIIVFCPGLNNFLRTCSPFLTYTHKKCELEILHTSFHNYIHLNPKQNCLVKPTPLHGKKKKKKSCPQSCLFQIKKKKNSNLANSDWIGGTESKYLVVGKAMMTKNINKQGDLEMAICTPVETIGSI